MSAAGTRSDVLVVTTGSRRPTGSFVVVAGCLGVLGLLGWAATDLDELSSVWRALSILGLTVVLLSDFWVLGAHVEVIGNWFRWRWRPRPAMRLTPDGLDYSAAFRGTFELHVDWPHAMETRLRAGPENAGSFWCLYAPDVEGAGDLRAFMTQEEIPGPDKAYATARAWRKRALAEDNIDFDQLCNLLAFGTPIALNLALAEGADLTDVDARVRDWTSGRCSLEDSV
jgi:hypothetical protein